MEAFYIGALFIALEVVSIVLAAVILVRPTRAAYVAMSIVGALAVIALVVSRTLGLPLIADDIGNWTEPLAVVSFGAEMLMVIGGASALLGRNASKHRPARFGLVAGLLVLALGGTATAFATAAESQGDDESGQTMSGMHMGLPADDGPTGYSTVTV